MKPLDFPLLSDENIAPDVVSGLRARGYDVRTAFEEDLIGRPDRDVLDRATTQNRVVVTHDLAFGKAAIRAGAPFVGIVYLRPGHISAEFVQQTQVGQREPAQIGTAQSPAVVRILPADQDAQEAARDQVQRESQAAANWWIVRLTGAVALFTLGLIAVVT